MINSAIEKGYDITSIQNILDSYEEQLKELDQQISQEITKMDKGKSTDTEILAKNEERLEQLQQKSDKLTSKVIEISGKMLDKINEYNKKITQKSLKEENRKDSDRIDSKIEYGDLSKKDFDENTVEIEK